MPGLELPSPASKNLPEFLPLRILSEVWLQAKTHQGQKSSNPRRKRPTFFKTEKNSSPDRQTRRNEPQHPSDSNSNPKSIDPSVESSSAKTNFNPTADVGKSVKNSVKHPSTKSYSGQSTLPITVCHWNCASGLSKKLDDIYLAIVELKPTVIFISEADWKKHQDDRLIQIKGYKLHNSESLEKHGKSRIIAYTRDGVDLKRRNDLESPDSEIIIFDKQSNNTSNFDRIIGLYRPFTGSDGDKSSGGTWTRFLHLLEVVNVALDGCHRATVVGDFNVDLLKDVVEQDRYTGALKNLCEENSLEQLIHQPTQIQTVKNPDGWKVQESLLDHVYSNDFINAQKCGSMHLSQSDHMVHSIRKF